MSVLAAAAISGGFKLISGLFKSNAIEKQKQAQIAIAYDKADTYDMQADIALENAIYAMQNADDVLEKSKRDINYLRLQGDMVKGAQEAAIGSSGFAVGSGSMGDVTMQTMKDVAADAEILMRNSQTESNAFEHEAMNLKRQASIYNKEAQDLRDNAGKGFEGQQAASILGTFAGIANTGGQIYLGSSSGNNPTSYNPTSLKTVPTPSNVA